MKYVLRRISYRYSNTIVDIAESKSRVCCMLDKVVELSVVGQVELQFEPVADTQFAGQSAALKG
jgi:hypothetical protein